MSGFEIAGVILGSLPLLIPAIEHVRKGLSTRRYDQQLQSLVRNLNAERVKLQNVCEKLLDGLVPPSQIRLMISEPLGDLWRDEDTARKIRARLWDKDSYEAFETAIQSISTSVEDLATKINTQRERQASLLKRGAFALQRTSYTETLTELKDNISNLVTLTSQSIDLEPSRRVRSYSRFLMILQNLSKSLYRAIQSSLATYPLEREAVWREMLAIKTVTEQSTTAPPPPETPLVSSAPLGDKSPSVLKKFKAKKSPYGRIVDTSRKYAVYPIHSNPSTESRLSTVSLRSILNGKAAPTPYLSCRDRLQIAVILASSMVQLHGSPWLLSTGTLTSRDIHFFVDNEGEVSISCGDPILVKRLTAPAPSTVMDQASQAITSKRNPALLSLGYLLLELFLGDTMESFRASAQAPTAVGNVLADYITAQKALEKATFPSENYRSAVSRCLQDIKPDNIFVKFRDHSLIESYLANVEVPEQDRSERYSPIPSRPLRKYYFNEADSQRVAEFDISLGDWGVTS
ncbi:hypothetical protein NEMBOFW57_001273 [Staphylotrichum longicolle]|uniref:DUF7580 domain-containing protein n=1 Tax=Staphylotrichum longicolle TaxID=669026 RepID=A0AAD4F1C5_9PEZI|nr:hypothetical protein NEMBOFW57_001273 [Staphylotrichum longicolle]